MLDGKPSIRKNRVPLDDPSYDPLFSYLEEEQIPVLYHSNDPKEFWDASRIPAWARQMYLYNEEFPQKDQITKETVGILKRHPKLNLTIAHMFFLPNTNEYELACNLMETYPNFFMDLTPGWEMFGDMHKEAEKWKKYVEKYSNRLVYGTDMGGNKEDADRLLAMKRALETTEEFDVGEYTCFGLGLEDSSLKNIYRDTYLHRIQKGCPRQISMDEIEDYVKNIELRIGKYRNIDKDKALIEVNKFYGFIQEEVKKR